MSSRDVLTMTRVPSFRTSPKRNPLLSSVAETSEDESMSCSGSALKHSLADDVVDSPNAVENKHCSVFVNEDIELSEPSIKEFLTRNSECCVKVVNEIVDKRTSFGSDKENNETKTSSIEEGQDALLACNEPEIQTSQESELTEIQTSKDSELAEIQTSKDSELAEIQTSKDSELAEIREISAKISSEMLSIDSLTRKKISSLQHCQSFEHADSEDEMLPANTSCLESPKKGASSLFVPEEEEANSQEDDEGNPFVVSHSRVTRNPSYQRAVTKACKLNRFTIDVAVTDEPLSQEIRPESSRTSNALHESQSAIELQGEPPSPPSSSTANATSSVVSRSVSFNDRLLESVKTNSNLSSRSSSSASKKEDSPPLPSSRKLHQMGSPEKRLTFSSSKSMDAGLAYGSTDANSQRKISLKSLTSNFSKKFSSKSSKADKKQESNNTSFPLQMVNGVPPSESSAAVVSYEGLLRLFECPGCQTLMLPPFLQCKKGHLLCEKCKITFKGTCPLCKQRVSDSTNYMMEQVCQLVRFPCKFGQFGCSEFYPPRQKADHEHFCHHRPVHCHFESNGCTKILPLKDMKQHLDDCQWKSLDLNQ